MISDQLYNNKRLDDWLREQDKSAFPGGADYARKLDQISEYLEENVYREVEKGALWNAIRSGDEPVYLNDHGKPHIDQVISRVTALLHVSKCELTPYEAYILLAAIYFHDVGNIYGRKEHEKTLGKVMLELGKLAGEETIEQRVIAPIAAAHGGIVKGTADDKDTIGKLEPGRVILSKKVRQQFLAALLRFADELADDYTRANRFMLDSGLLEDSEVYHAYSQSLHSVMIEQDIALHFEMSRGDALRQFGKGIQFSVGCQFQSDFDNNTIPDELRHVFENKKCPLSQDATVSIEEQGNKWKIKDPNAEYVIRKEANKLKIYGNLSVFLLDEIFARTLKMHLERVYCMRFLIAQLSINRIRVTIEVFENIEQDYFIGTPLETIFYTLEETGYPNAPTGGIQELCPELCKWTGETLKEKLLSLRGENNGEI